MRIKIWKNQNIVEAKKLEKMPEYGQFVRTRRFYDKLCEDRKYVATVDKVPLDRIYAADGKPYAEVINDLNSHLKDWRMSSDALFLQEIDRKKGELKEDAKLLLEKARIRNEKSEPMLLLEEADKTARKIGKKLAVACGIVMVVALIPDIVPVIRPVIYEAIGEVTVALGGVGLAVGSFFGVGAGLSLAVNGQFKGALQTFKEAMGIAKEE